jgi:hypothetical protein
MKRIRPILKNIRKTLESSERIDLRKIKEYDHYYLFIYKMVSIKGYADDIIDILEEGIDS